MSVLEQGHIYFFYRPRVETHEPESAEPSAWHHEAEKRTADAQSDERCHPGELAGDDLDRTTVGDGEEGGQHEEIVNVGRDERDDGKPDQCEHT